MAWERRKRGTLYYTRTRRINGRQVREYCGCGQIGRLAAAEDEHRRLVQERQQRRRHEEQRQIEECERLLSAQATLCTRQMHIVFTAAGYHNHHNEWRKRRGTQGAEQKAVTD